jgi:hypothetical protein
MSDAVPVKKTETETEAETETETETEAVKKTETETEADIEARAVRIALHLSAHALVEKVVTRKTKTLCCFEKPKRPIDITDMLVPNHLAPNIKNFYSRLVRMGRASVDDKSILKSTKNMKEMPITLEKAAEQAASETISFFQIKNTIKEHLKRLKKEEETYAKVVKVKKIGDKMMDVSIKSTNKEVKQAKHNKLISGYNLYYETKQPEVLYAAEKQIKVKNKTMDKLVLDTFTDKLYWGKVPASPKESDINTCILENWEALSEDEQEKWAATERGFVVKKAKNAKERAVKASGLQVGMLEAGWSQAGAEAVARAEMARSAYEWVAERGEARAAAVEAAAKVAEARAAVAEMVEAAKGPGATAAVEGVAATGAEREAKARAVVLEENARAAVAKAVFAMAEEKAEEKEAQRLEEAQRREEKELKAANEVAAAVAARKAAEAQRLEEKKEAQRLAEEEKKNLLRKVDKLLARLDPNYDEVKSAEDYEHRSLPMVVAALMMLKHAKIQIAEESYRADKARIIELQWKQQRANYRADLKDKLTNLLVKKFNVPPVVVTAMMSNVDFNHKNIYLTDIENDELIGLIDGVKYSKPLAYEKWRQARVKTLLNKYYSVIYLTAKEAAELKRLKAETAADTRTEMEGGAPSLPPLAPPLSPSSSPPPPLPPIPMEEEGSEELRWEITKGELVVPTWLKVQLKEEAKKEKEWNMAELAATKKVNSRHLEMFEKLEELENKVDRPSNLENIIVEQQKRAVRAAVHASVHVLVAAEAAEEAYQVNAATKAYHVMENDGTDERKFNGCTTDHDAIENFLQTAIAGVAPAASAMATKILAFRVLYEYNRPYGPYTTAKREDAALFIVEAINDANIEAKAATVAAEETYNAFNVALEAATSAVNNPLTFQNASAKALEAENAAFDCAVNAEEAQFPAKTPIVNYKQLQVLKMMELVERARRMVVPMAIAETTKRWNTLINSGLSNKNDVLVEGREKAVKKAEAEAKVKARAIFNTLGTRLFEKMLQEEEEAQFHEKTPIVNYEQPQQLRNLMKMIKKARIAQVEKARIAQVRTVDFNTLGTRLFEKMLQEEEKKNTYVLSDLIRGVKTFPDESVSAISSPESSPEAKEEEKVNNMATALFNLQLARSERNIFIANNHDYINNVKKVTKDRYGKYNYDDIAEELKKHNDNVKTHKEIFQKIKENTGTTKYTDKVEWMPAPISPMNAQMRRVTKRIRRISSAIGRMTERIRPKPKLHGSDQQTGGSNKKTKRKRKTKRKKQNKRKTKRKKQNKRKTKRKRKSIKRR